LQTFQCCQIVKNYNDAETSSVEAMCQDSFHEGI